MLHNISSVRNHHDINLSVFCLHAKSPLFFLLRSYSSKIILNILRMIIDSNFNKELKSLLHKLFFVLFIFNVLYLISYPQVSSFHLKLQLTKPEDPSAYNLILKHSLFAHSVRWKYPPFDNSPCMSRGCRSRLSMVSKYSCERMTRR